MENLVNKKVRLRNQLTKTTLVASSDKKSVNHIRLDDNKPKPENSVWIIKSTHPEKAVRLVSVYGKLLAWKSEESLMAIQVDRPRPQNKAGESGHNWWKIEKINQSGFTCVRILNYIKATECFACLFPDVSNGQVVVGYKKEFPWWNSWLFDRYFNWELEIVEDAIIDPGPVTTKSEDNPPTPLTSYIYQVDRMYVYQQRMAGTSFPFPSNANANANSGGNVNNSGTQIVGGVNVQTH